jgi:hypothetical protein
MALQAPGWQATTQETPRVLKRATLELFVFGFFYDEAKTQPVAPVDPTTHPNFKIFDLNGQLLQDGVAIPATSPGYWRVAWYVPKDAALTNIHRRYRFQTVMADANLRQFETSFEFDVVESAVPAQKPEEQQRLAFVGRSKRLFFHDTVRPVSLSARLIAQGNDANPLYMGTFVYPPAPVPGPNDIIEVPDGTGYTYYFDTPPFPNIGTYTVLWFVRDFPLSEEDISAQNIEVVNTFVIQLMTRLRMYIDKVQKKLGIVYAYRDEELYAYLDEGLGTINQGVPPTYYTLQNLPTPMHSLLLMAAMMWGLMAQRILYTETNFDHSGQTVTLGYNPGADLDGIIDRMQTALSEQLRKTKEGVVRAQSPVGFLAARPIRYGRNMVFKVGRVTNNSPLGNNDIGLLLSTYGITM